MIFIEDDPLSHSYRHRKIEENDKGNKRNEQKPKYIHPNIYIHSKQRQKTRDKKKKNHHFVQEKKKKDETKPRGKEINRQRKKTSSRLGNLLFTPEIKEKYCYTMQALNAHGAGRRRTKPNGPQSKGEQLLLQGPQMRMRMRHRQKGREGVMISSVNRKSCSISGVHHQSPLRIYGDAMREWRRDGGGNEKDEDWEGGKAGEEGPVMGGVAVR